MISLRWGDAAILILNSEDKTQEKGRPVRLNLVDLKRFLVLMSTALSCFVSEF